MNTKNMEEILTFTNRFIIITYQQYQMLKKRMKLEGNVVWNDNIVCIDYDNNKVVFSGNGKTSQGITIDNELTLSCFDQYRTYDESIHLNCDKVKPRKGKFIEKYVINGVWLVLIYETPKKNKKLLLNKNIFGTYTTMQSRDFKLDKILQEIEEEEE